MIKRKIFGAVVFAIVIAATLFSSCKKNNNPQPLEPISVVLPDSSIITKFAGDSLPIEIKFTTDRPIDWILAKYDIDTLIDTLHYTATYPDTFFFKGLYVPVPRTNLYTFKGTYYIPDTIPPFSVLRFKISFLAGSDTIFPGQNYARGTTGAEKEFVVNIR
jgi:hypothetical protein